MDRYGHAFIQHENDDITHPSLHYNIKDRMSYLVLKAKNRDHGRICAALGTHGITSLSGGRLPAAICAHICSFLALA